MIKGRRGTGGGENVMNEIGPPVSPWSACLFGFSHEGFFLIFLRAQKYWWETHLLDPLLIYVMVNDHNVDQKPNHQKIVCQCTF